MILQHLDAFKREDKKAENRHINFLHESKVDLTQYTFAIIYYLIYFVQNLSKGSQNYTSAFYVKIKRKNNWNFEIS